MSLRGSLGLPGKLPSDSHALSATTLTSRDHYDQSRRSRPIPLRRVSPVSSPALQKGGLGIALGSTSQVPRSSQSQLPYACVGKLIVKFPKTPADETMEGSAWRAGEYGILTAAHCLYDHKLGGGITWGVFVPHSDDDSTTKEPFGRFPLMRTHVPDFWKVGEMWQYDIGGCHVLGLPPEVPIVKHIIDWRDIAFTMNAIGYPIKPKGSYPFDGGNMWQTRGQAVLARQMPHEPGYRGWIRSPLTPGTSGGPWIMKFKGKWTVCALTAQIGGNGLYSPEVTNKNPIVRELLKTINSAPS